jgi:hypothetical protein
MCARRSITHKLTNYKGSIITNVVTSRLLSHSLYTDVAEHSLYTDVAEVKYKTIVVAPITGTLTGWLQV